MFVNTRFRKAGIFIVLKKWMIRMESISVDVIILSFKSFQSRFVAKEGVDSVLASLVRLSVVAIAPPQKAAECLLRPSFTTR